MKLPRQFSWDFRRVHSHHYFHERLPIMKLVWLLQSRLPWTSLYWSNHCCYPLLPSHGRSALASATLYPIRAWAEPLHRHSSKNNILQNWLNSLWRSFRGGGKAIGYVVIVQNIVSNYFHRKLVTQQKWCNWRSYHSIRIRNWQEASWAGAEQKESCIVPF